MRGGEDWLRELDEEVAHEVKNTLDDVLAAAQEQDPGGDYAIKLAEFIGHGSPLAVQYAQRTLERRIDDGDQVARETLERLRTLVPSRYFITSDPRDA